MMLDELECSGRTEDVCANSELHPTTNQSDQCQPIVVAIFSCFLEQIKTMTSEGCSSSVPEQQVSNPIQLESQNITCPLSSAFLTCFESVQTSLLRRIPHGSSGLGRSRRADRRWRRCSPHPGGARIRSIRSSRQPSEPHFIPASGTFPVFNVPSTTRSHRP